MPTATLNHPPRRAAPATAARPAKTVKPAHYLLLLGTIAVLNVVGVVMVLSASSVVSITNYGSAWYFFERQLIWTVLGVIGFAVAVRIDYRRWRDWVTPLLFVTTALLVLVLIPHFGIYVSGSRRWLGFGSWRFQPTELAKLALVVFGAHVLTRREHELHDWRATIRPILLVVALLGGLVFLEPDLDSTVLLGVIVQSLIALGSGGVGGVGLGSGRSKWLFLPNAHTDFIFSVIGEELGLVGCLAVLGLFGAFAVLGIRTARRAPDRFGMLLASGITIWVVAQAAVNIGGVTGLLPVSGVPLPFVSFGGSALVFTMIAAGILANVARQAR
jgi:cell division protein FtsW